MASIEGTDEKFEHSSANAERDSRSHESQEMTGSRASLGSDGASWVVVSDPSTKSSVSEPGGVSIRDEPAAGNETMLHDNAVDVGRYIDLVLGGEDFAFWAEDVKAEVREQLIKNADGMPQYAGDQLEQLKKFTASEYVLRALGDLPQNIDAVYERMLLSTDERLRPQIVSSLKWAAFSIDTLDVSLLSEIFTLHLDRDQAATAATAATALDEAEASADDILKHFSGLLVQENGYIQFDRPYIKEYLTSSRIRNGPASSFSFTSNDAHLHIAKTCLEYHLQCNPSDSSTTAWTIVEEYNEEDKSKLQSYATKNWPLHLESVPRSFWSPEICQAANLALDARSRSLYSMTKSVLGQFAFGDAWLNPLKYTAHVNAHQLTEMLISEGFGTHEYITQSDLDDALLEAASAGNYETVQLLLEKGAAVDAKTTSLYPLKEAIKGSYLEIVRFLVDEKTVSKILSEALNDAAREGDFEIVEFLVLNNTPATKSAMKLVAGSFGDSPESLECLQFLLDHSKGMKLEGALCMAASRGCWKAFEMLRSRGADINGVDGRCGTPLHQVCAAQNLDESRVEYLLGLGANPKTRAGLHGAPLQAVCYSTTGRDEKAAIRVAKLLLAHGAGINRTGGALGSALKNACGSTGKDGVSWYSLVEFLLQNGADVNEKGGRYDTALQAACDVGHVDIVRLLLDRGAIVSPGGEGYVHAFVHAIIAACDTRPNDGYNGDIEIVQLLLDHGADINQTGSNSYGCALQAAAQAGNIKLVRFLLDHGAEIDLDFANCGTALKAACANGYNEIARLLLDRGADANAGGRNAGVIIQTACWTERSDDEMIHMLLDHGADIKLTGFTYVPLFNMAVISDGIKDNATLKRLLDLGADINEVDMNRGTPLHAVLRKLFQDSSLPPSRIRFLIEHGADVNFDIAMFGYGSPLHHLCANPYYDSTKYPPHEAAALLFELCPQLDVNAKGGRYGSALQAAVFCDLEETVQVLLDHGADVNASGGRYNNALNAAVVRGFWNTAKKLLDLGATPDCYRQDSPDEKWLAGIEREDGKKAVERYKKFWEVERKKYVEREGK